MQSYRYEFKKEELFYLLFANKVCPKCGHKLIKEKHFEVVDGSIYNKTLAPSYIKLRDVKRYFYCFTCENCKASYTLSELSDKKGD